MYYRKALELQAFLDMAQHEGKYCVLEIAVQLIICCSSVMFDCVCITRDFQDASFFFIFHSWMGILSCFLFLWFWDTVVFLFFGVHIHKIFSLLKL